MHLPSPLRLFRIVATAEAVTWTLLVVGMVLKYVTKTTELGVRVGGMLHGVVFIAYVLTCVALWVDQRWSPRTALTALVSAIPPWLTLWFERRVERDHLVGQQWRLGAGGQRPASAPERVLAAALARPLLGLVVALVGIAAVTAVLLLVGPPVPKS
ncbi:DUF3817 domain-containing protein [Janibacter melonis]|uniref:DUF3817 domain-containing protein n=1 Tax=Janibacter melonis TaxID=262209 RepID=UPI00174B9520|nr:DUF3817 domain-containing protein [Janibacter melonis]